MSNTVRLIYGIGINDANYPLVNTVEFPYKDGKRQQKVVWRCPYYIRWCSVLERSYSEKFKEKHPTYKDVTCCEEWLTFSKFKSWMETQDWEGKDLDKDLLVYQNKIYSPETCCFLSHKINTFLTTSAKIRGDQPIGVYWHKRDKCYISRIRTGSRKFEVLGYFKDSLEAHKAWQKAKIDLCYNFIELEQDSAVKRGLLRIYHKIRNDILENVETFDF